MIEDTVTDERGRLDAVERLRALDRIADPALQSLARLAAHISGARSAAVHIFDADKQRRIAGHEVALVDHPSSDSLCRLVVETGAPILAPDATREERFAYSPFVGGEQPVRFYAAVPMRTLGGDVIGTVCAFDTVERSLEPKAMRLLDDIAIQAVTHLELMQLVGDLGAAATKDELTGAANRLILGDRLAHHLARLDRHEHRLIVAAIDLDGFKQVNDTLGHAAGDVVLREVVRRLASCVREEDLVARVGGDEFVVAAEIANDAIGLGAFAGRLRRAIARPVEIGERAVVPAATVGAVYAKPVGETVAAVLARADAELYREKREPRA